jgi:hypothetical protein
VIQRRREKVANIRRPRRFSIYDEKKTKTKIGFCSLFCLSVLTQMKKKWQNVFVVFVCTNILSVAVLSLFREKGKIIYKGVPIRSCLDLVQKGRNTTSNHDDDDVSTGQPKKNHSKFFWDFQRNILNDVLVFGFFFFNGMAPLLGAVRP